ncbi:MAG: diaminopimelate epimerase [bacterium P3]|nr:MAG: diaminopimelate epimerase [bacterium P3]KWW41960.1 MAG: diaminopimelate epimerase [bacterium F083]
MEFYKFDGAGNDFILVDVRRSAWVPDAAQVAAMCHRRLGIGADGLMTLGLPPADVAGCQFSMTYFNSDGSRAAMCGNGGRCIALFAHLSGLTSGGASAPLRFMADDGLHEADILMWDKTARVGLVRIAMRDVARSTVRRCLDGWLLDTGVPHYVQRVSGLAGYDVEREGRRLRHAPELGAEGANIDFIEDRDDGRLMIRTYERGVEGETLSCGTGVTAAAIVSGNGRVSTRGGDFAVAFSAGDDSYSGITLTGPVSLNFTGDWNL